MLEHLRKGMSKLAQQLDLEFGYTVANHNFELGLPRENALQQFFRPYFPDRYGFGSGYLVDADESVSNQSDWIIYDRFHFSPLLAKSHVADGVEFYPFDSAFAAVEVKSTLTPSVLETALTQIGRTRTLKRQPASPVDLSPILNFASHFDRRLQQILTNYFYMVSMHTPSQNCLLQTM